MADMIPQVVRDHWVLAAVALAFTWPWLLMFSPILVPSALIVRYLSVAPKPQRGSKALLREAEIIMQPLHTEPSSTVDASKPPSSDSGSQEEQEQGPSEDRKSKEISSKAGDPKSEEVPKESNAHDDEEVSPSAVTQPATPEALLVEDKEKLFPSSPTEQHHSARSSTESLLPVSTDQIQSPEPHGKRLSYVDRSAVPPTSPVPAKKPADEEQQIEQWQTPAKKLGPADSDDELHHITPAPSPPATDVGVNGAPPKTVKKEERGPSRLAASPENTTEGGSQAQTRSPPPKERPAREPSPPEENSGVESTPHAKGNGNATGGGKKAGKKKGKK